MADPDDRNEDEEEGEGLEAGETATESKEPKASKAWLEMIADAEKAFKTYQGKADNIDKTYANLEKLANTVRDREFQLFWANISVLGPSIYSRPPIPVVIPRFKDRQELPRTASELLERSCIVSFEKEDVDGVMRLVRDDLVILARGVPWLRYEAKGKGDKFTEKVCIDHADRKDWLCEPARNWKEVDWVAKRAWLTKPEMRKRFKKTSGDVYKDADFAIRKDGQSDADDGKRKAGVWEIWSKSLDKVVWVSEGCEKCLDEDKPHLNLEGFFPCPRPAYGTVQRRSLVPVPDMLFYKDQLEEINEITARIAALTEAVKVRGFYPAGAGEIGDAIESALKATSNNQIMVPVSNWAMIGTGAVKDMIVWLPIDVITATITALIQLRKALIEDVYQITGLSDIMRGQTAASETLGAQQLKSQYGSIRIKDRQDELTRVARDITRITAEIMAENFQPKTLLEMSQLQIPSDADIAKQATPLQAQLQQITATLPQIEQKLAGMQQEIQHAQADPEVQQMAQANPDQAKQIIGQVQQQAQQLTQQAAQMKQQGQQLQVQLGKLAQTVTIEKVMQLLREQKLRPFILDIETDSTIAPDENASKQRATEFVTAVGGYMREAMPLVTSMPQAAGVVADTLKFVTSQFRAGRELEGTIDQFADAMKAKAEQPSPPNPEAMKAQAEAQAAQAKQKQDAETSAADNAAKMAGAQKTAAEAQATQAAAQKSLIDAQSKAADDDLKRRITEQEAIDASDARKVEIDGKVALTNKQIELLNAKRADEMARHAIDMDKGVLEIELLRGKTAHVAVTTAGTMARDQATIDAKEAVAKQPAPEATA
jgi:hypothetical protein